MSNKQATFICFTGMDGSGKTTLAKASVDELNKHGIKCKYVYSRLAPFLLQPLIFIGQKLFLRGENISEDYATYSATKKKAIKNSPFSSVYEWILLVDYSIQVFLKVKLPLMQGKNIVCDRYIYDTIATDLAVDFDYSEEKIERVMNLLFRLFPKPEITFLIDVPVETAYRRKNDIPSMRYIADRRKIYIKLGKKEGMRILDGTKSLEELKSQISHIVLSNNITVRLLRLLGSPFVGNVHQPSNDQEALELYLYAKMNKIGLLCLKALNESGRLNEFQLRQEYEEDETKHNKQLMTMSRVCGLLNSIEVNYAVFKSIMPFPAVPNDVDIVHFGSDKEFEAAAKKLIESGYVEVKGPVDAKQRMFHDTRDGACLDPHPDDKDVYDVDLYQKMSASHIVYLDKRKLSQYVVEISLPEMVCKVLQDKAELMTIITHSIIPEQLLTLSAYFASLYYLKQMNEEEITALINLAKTNQVLYPIRAHCSLVASLHQLAYGFVPEQLKTMLDRTGTDDYELGRLKRSNFRTPHRYSWRTVAKTIIEKSRDYEFRRSIIAQIISMLNPRVGIWVVGEIIWRRRRETY